MSGTLTGAPTDQPQNTAVPNGITNVGWALWVLTDAGYPTTVNNVNNLLAWMAAENPPSDWTAGSKNNPLNNGLGSGGGSGLGSYPDLATAAQYAAKGLQGGITGGQYIGQALAANAPFSVFHAATLQATWSGDHYAGTDWAAATSVFSVPVVSSAAIKGAAEGASNATGTVIQGAAGAASTATNALTTIAKLQLKEFELLGDLTSASWWKRAGLFVGGFVLVIGGIVLFVSTTKTGQTVESDAALAAVA